MPELPDVELFKRKLEACKGERIIKAEVLLKKILSKISEREFINAVEGKRIVEIERRGKFLIAKLDSKKNIVFHFGLTGKLIISEKKEIPKFTRIILKCKKKNIYFINKRLFGKIFVVGNPYKEIETIAKMGPEPLKLKKNEFLKMLEKHESMNVKAFLMDQTIIAGIGNIFSDEILFQSGILPSRKIKSLNKRERETLFEKMVFVLKVATKRAEKNYEELMPNEAKKEIKKFIIPHRHTDQICPKCGAKLKHQKIATRTSYFCTKCQK